MVKKFITKLIKNHTLAVLSVVYLVFRIINLIKLPIFNDEAIYLDWGWKSLHSGVGLFYSLYDAKPPFLIWIFGTFEGVIHSPLLAGRLVSVLTGLLSLIGIYKVAKNLENEKVACLASFLYIIIPLFAFFDRQALMESSLGTVGIWSFYFLLQLLKTKKNDYAIYLGWVLGIGVFIKLSALIFLVPIIIVLIYKKYFRAVIVTLFFDLIVLSPLYFQKTFWTSLGSDNRFVISISEILHLPLSLWISNVFDTINISFSHLTPFVLLLAIAGIYLFIKNKKSLLPFYFLVNIFLVISLSRVVSPRYLIPFLVPITIFSSYAILTFKKFFLIGGLVILPALLVTILLTFSPIKYFNFLSKLTAYSQKDDYVTNWTSGYGIPEIVNYLNQKGKMGKIIIGVRVDAGNPESAMFAYYDNGKTATPTYLDSKIVEKTVLNLKCLTSPLPLYFIARDGNLAGLDNFFQEDKRFYKPEGPHFISIDILKKCN